MNTKKVTTLNQNEEWNNLKELKNNESYVVDADHTLANLDRIITGIEILAKIVSPKEFDYIQTPENSCCKLIINDLLK